MPALRLTILSQIERAASKCSMRRWSRRFDFARSSRPNESARRPLKILCRTENLTWCSSISPRLAGTVPPIPDGRRAEPGMRLAVTEPSTYVRACSLGSTKTGGPCRIKARATQEVDDPATNSTRHVRGARFMAHRSWPPPDVLNKTHGSVPEWRCTLRVVDQQGPS
jgi:hypothetical protein